MSHLVINWTSLLRAAGLSIAIGVTLVSVFTVGVLGYARIDDPASSPFRRRSGFALASSALVICAAAVLFGVYLLIPKLH